MIRTTRTRFKTFLEVKERIPDKDQRTGKKKNRREVQDKTTKN
jgi:hypothetical protein